MEYGPLFEKIESTEIDVTINVVSGFKHLKTVIKNHALFYKLRFAYTNHKFFNLVISNRIKYLARFGARYDIALCFYILALSETEDSQYKNDAYDEVRGHCNPHYKLGLYWTEKILRDLPSSKLV